jgi:hypothetical protein
MPLDVLEADFVGLAQNGVGGATPRCLDAQGVKLDFLMKALQRDDPMRRLYLQRRWHGHLTSVPLASGVRCFNFGCACLSPIVLSRR